jgi:hypothetical protein
MDYIPPSRLTVASIAIAALGPPGIWPSTHAQAPPQANIVAPAEPTPSITDVPPQPFLAPRADQSSPGGLDQLARVILLANLPRNYENSKNWGLTKPRWDGLHVHLDGGRITTKRRWKEVNHGTWTQYRAWLVDPEQQLHLQSNNLRTTDDQRVAVDLLVSARVGASGRLSEWNRGLQLYSFRADAEASLQLKLSCELATRLDATRIPPDVILEPRVVDASLDLHNFQLQRISRADGPLVHKLGDMLRDDIEREVNSRRQKLVEKLNRALDKQSGNLRLSIHDLARNGWDQLVRTPAKP